MSSLNTQCSFTLCCSATVAGPLTAERNQCENGETKSTNNPVTIRCIEEMKVDLNTTERAESTQANKEGRKEKRLKSITSLASQFVSTLICRGLKSLSLPR